MTYATIWETHQHSWTMQGKDIDEFITHYKNPSEGLCDCSSSQTSNGNLKCDGLILDKVFATNTSNPTGRVFSCPRKGFYSFDTNSSKQYCKACCFYKGRRINNDN